VQHVDDTVAASRLEQPVLRRVLDGEPRLGQRRHRGGDVGLGHPRSCPWAAPGNLAGALESRSYAV
jgi:hypothetical protein